MTIAEVLRAATAVAIFTVFFQIVRDYSPDPDMALLGLIVSGIWMLCELIGVIFVGFRPEEAQP
jgi:hypothetical protein